MVSGNNEFINRPLPMSDKAFSRLSARAFELTGIMLPEHKKNLVYSRIVRRVRALSLHDFDEYCNYLDASPEKEANQFVNAITTNLTSFFREGHHFDSLKQKVLPQLVKSGKRKIRIWSAGCSTGEEPYSIAMTVHQVLGNSGLDIRILATDLDSNVLNTGRNGVYDYARVENLPKELVRSCFSLNKADYTVTVKPEIRQYIRFNRLNLMQEWPMKKPFDIIFCRNVVIYFNKDTQRVLFNRYADQLDPHGYLFIGHSETLGGVSDRFEAVGKTEYRRVR